MGFTYKDAGVDVEGGNKFVKRIAPLVKSTFTDRVITDIGGFGSLYNGSFPEYKEPILVSSTDGVGTKLKIAQLLNKHDTIGIDAVAMCVNDIIVSGAKPLFFLDYIACGKLHEDILVDVVKGLVAGCLMSECSLVGGETAEHPNVMDIHDYDIAGFTVGVVDKVKIIDGKSIVQGDIVIGLSSSGIHSNGYSLVRKLFIDSSNYDLSKKIGDFELSLGQVLLEPTRIYVKSILNILKSGITIKGIVHITGGGFYENIPRILPPSTSVLINKNAYDIPEIFKLMQRDGKIGDIEMYTTFNMGIGMILIVDKINADLLIDKITDLGEKAYIIGKVESGNKEVIIK